MYGHLPKEEKYEIHLFLYSVFLYSVTFQESVIVFFFVFWIGDLCLVMRKAASLPRLAFIFFEHLETWVPFISTVFLKKLCN